MDVVVGGECAVGVVEVKWGVGWVQDSQEQRERTNGSSRILKCEWVFLCRSIFLLPWICGSPVVVVVVCFISVIEQRKDQQGRTKDWERAEGGIALYERLQDKRVVQ